MLFEAFKAFIIGLVEGITEWLPISSTGHMILVDEFMKLSVSDSFLAMFLVVIQIGAILAVIILYFNKLNPFSPSKTPEGRRATWRLWGMVVVGCIPAAVVGLLLDDWAEEHLFNATVVAAMLILYGIIFIILERRNRKKEANFAPPVAGKHAKLDGSGYEDGDMFRISTVDDIGPLDAIKIGLFQCLAVVPGTSRSGAIIIGGMLTGCSRVAAAEFAFFLAIPVMLGWGLVKAVKFISAGLVLTQIELVVLIVGVVTAFVTSIIAIKFLLSYIKRNDFAVFGWYRIVVGIVVLGYFAFKGALF